MVRRTEARAEEFGDCGNDRRLRSYDNAVRPAARRDNRCICEHHQWGRKSAAAAQVWLLVYDIVFAFPSCYFYSGVYVFTVVFVWSFGLQNIWRKLAADFSGILKKECMFGLYVDILRVLNHLADFLLLVDRMHFCSVFWQVMERFL